VCVSGGVIVTAARRAGWTAVEKPLFTAIFSPVSTRKIGQFYFCGEFCLGQRHEELCAGGRPRSPLQSDSKRSYLLSIFRLYSRTQDLAYLLRLQHRVLGKEHHGAPLDSINGSDQCRTALA
jgi:hypothetical protein